MIVNHSSSAEIWLHLMVVVKETQELPFFQDKASSFKKREKLMDHFNQQLVKSGHHSQLESLFILLQVQILGDEKSGGEIRIAPAVQW